jgi:hypothetical protein
MILLRASLDSELSEGILVISERSDQDLGVVIVGEDEERLPESLVYERVVLCRGTDVPLDDSLRRKSRLTVRPLGDLASG